ncbi:MAG: 30S ribosomal protein S4 [Planctomycetota bacterium]
MARHTGPTCKLCRREGTKLFLKGKRCESNKCKMDAGPAHAAMRKMRGKTSTYGRGLREKQKMKLHYGLLEKQFRRYVDRARSIKGNTTTAMVQMIERRLDNVVKRLGVAWAPRHARQMISHGHVRVNGKKVDIASYELRVGDEISFVDKTTITDLMKECQHFNSRRMMVPSWLEFDETTFKGRVRSEPTMDEMSMPVDVQLIVEWCSR